MNTFINISGVYNDEGWVLPATQTLDMSNLQGCCCYCDPEAEAALREAIAPMPLSGMHWIDTGDYHYLSKLWMEKITEPFVLALFDNHTDDQATAFGSLLSCGSWVLSAREELPLMKADYLNTSEIPGDLPVYLSIDLDVLSPEYARTDWDQGSLSLSDLTDALGRIAFSHRIIGADICGGLTPAKGASAGDLKLNYKTKTLLKTFLSQLL